MLRSRSARRHAAVRTPDRTRTIALVHGKDLSTAAWLEQLLGALGLQAIRWHDVIESSLGGPSGAGAATDAARTRAQAIVALITGDEVGAVQRERLSGSVDPEGDLEFQPSQDLLVDIGIILGRLSGPEEVRLVPVLVGPARLPAALERRTPVVLDGSGTGVQQLVVRLREAGCMIPSGAAARAAREVPLALSPSPLPVLVEPPSNPAAAAPRFSAFFTLGCALGEPDLAGRAAPVAPDDGELFGTIVSHVRDLGLAAEPGVVASLRTLTRSIELWRRDPNATCDPRERSELIVRACRDVTAAVRVAGNHGEKWAFHLGILMVAALRRSRPTFDGRNTAVESAVGAFEDHLAVFPLSPPLARLLKRFARLARSGSATEVLESEFDAVRRTIELVVTAPVVRPDETRS